MKLTVTVDGEKFSKWKKGYITSAAKSYTEVGSTIFQYTVASSIPAEWHYGKILASGVQDDILKSYDEEREYGGTTD